MSIKTFLQGLFPQDPFLGVAEDTRSEDEKMHDPLHQEVAGGSIPFVTWIEKRPDQWKSISPLRSQNLSSFDCCAFSTTTGMQADKNISYALSARDIYDQRSNYPEPGMIPFESVSIPAAKGVLSDSWAPSDNLPEGVLNVRVQRTSGMIQYAKALAGGTPIRIPMPADIDTIASIIAKGMSVRLCFFFTLKEWTQEPQLITGGAIRHQVIGLDYAIHEGKKGIIIQDSCFPDTTYYPRGLRFIDEAFLSQRCFSAVYILPDLPPAPPVQMPVHKFVVDLEYGDSNSEVMLMQSKLQALGFFNVAPTGYFGGITFGAVKNFQKAHNINPTGYFGPLTRAAINSL